MLFESAILPAQYYPSRRSNAEMEPERRLAFAVLTDAIRCFQLNLGAAIWSKMGEFAEAESWTSRLRTMGPFPLRTCVACSRFTLRTLERY